MHLVNGALPSKSMWEGPPAPMTVCRPQTVGGVSDANFTPRHNRFHFLGKARQEFTGVHVRTTGIAQRYALIF
jgi:hypothetical protein